MGLYSITLNKWSYLMRLYSVHFLCLSILSKRISNFQVDFISIIAILFRLLSPFSIRKYYLTLNTLDEVNSIRKYL